MNLSISCRCFWNCWLWTASPMPMKLVIIWDLGALAGVSAPLCGSRYPPWVLHSESQHWALLTGTEHLPLQGTVRNSVWETWSGGYSLLDKSSKTFWKLARGRKGISQYIWRTYRMAFFFFFFFQYVLAITSVKPEKLLFHLIGWGSDQLDLEGVPAHWRGVGLDDLWRYLWIQIHLWLYDSI